MKKVLFVAAFAAIGFTGIAQTSFGIQGGANFANLQIKSDGQSDHTKTKVGFIVGAVASVDFGNSISFRPELNYIQKGGLQEQDFLGVNYKDKIVLGYVQLAPNFVYNFSAGKSKAFIGIGPDFSFGISGRERIKASGSGVNTSDDTNVKFDGDENATDNDIHLKSFDFGGNILAGYNIYGGFITVGYTLGFSNIAPGGDNNNSLKNRGFNVKLGYMFGGKMHK